LNLLFDGPKKGESNEWVVIDVELRAEMARSHEALEEHDMTDVFVTDAVTIYISTEQVPY
jgi:hypothetical protein